MTAKVNHSVIKLQKIEEPGESLPFLLGKPHEGVTRCGPLAAVPQYRLCQAACATVVKEHGVSVDRLHQTDAPQWRSAPLLPRCLEVGAFVGQFRPHVVQQQVGLGIDGLVAQCIHFVRAGSVLRRVADRAAGIDEDARSPPHLRVLYVTHGRHGQCLIVLDYHDQQLGADFRRTSIRTIQAVVLWLVAVFIREYD